MPVAFLDIVGLERGRTAARPGFDAPVGAWTTGIGPAGVWAPAS